MRKKVIFIAALLLGIFIGIGIGVPIGMLFSAEPVQPVVTGIPSPSPANTCTPAPTVTNTPMPTPTATNTPTPTVIPVVTNGFPGALHVEGTHLATEDGGLIQLRGISTHGLAWFPGYVNADMIAQTKKEWGCNVIRLAMYTAESGGYCVSGVKEKKALKDLIDIGVKAAVEQNMYVIIDWHILSDANPNSNKGEAKAFFAEMAKKYKDVPNVIYEICNEPNGGTGWTDIKKYALEVIPVIREQAPNAVIIVGTPTWSQDVDTAAKDPITGYDNIMYALHFYAATHKENLRDKCNYAVAKGLPVFVTEYGICDAQGSGAIDEAQADAWIEMLDSYGISHVMWNLSNKSETSAMIKSSISKTSSLKPGDLSASGIWFVNMMKNAGLSSDEWITPEAEDGNGNENDNNIDSGNAAPSTPEIPKLEDLFETNGDLKISVSNSWVSENGFGIQLNVTVKNAGEKEENDWKRELKIKPGKKITVNQFWCAGITADNERLIIRPEEYNKTIPAGGEVTGIGIIIEVK